MPEIIVSYIHSEKIKLVKENGIIVMSPISDKYSILEESFGMFADGKLSSKKLIEERKLEKELEGVNVFIKFIQGNPKL